MCLRYQISILHERFSSTGFLPFPAVLEDECSLSVQSKLTAVTNGQAKLLTILDDRCCRLRILWFKSAPQAIICSAVHTPATLLKDSTNQPERVNLFAVPVSSPD